jgi:protein-L-isoaspartate(D-aspartate) O-methyltransferase
MATQAELFAEARKRMVDSQIRPNRVTDPRILSAMRRLPREAFLPAAAHALAYTDEDVPLGNGRFLMEPMVLARMLQAAVPQENERVLVVGAATGYGAAILDSCGCRVTALEEDPALLNIATAVLAEEAPNVSVVSSPLSAGWPQQAPYDLILIEGAVPDIPAAMASQIRQESGRIIAVLCREGGVTQAVQAEATASGLGVAVLFDCGTPPIPSLRKAPSFAF